MTKHKTKFGRIYKKYDIRDGVKVDRCTWTVRYKCKDYATGETDAAKAKIFLEKLVGQQAGMKKYGPRQRLQPTPTPAVEAEILMDELFDDLAADARRKDNDTAFENEGRVDKNLRPHFGKIPAAKLKTDDITTYIDHRLENDEAGRATVNKELAWLKRSLRIAAFETEPPKVLRFPKIILLPVSNARKGFLSHDQYAKLKSHLPSYLVPVFVTGYHVGNRRGELLQVELKDIEMDAALPQFRLYPDATKSGEGRIVPILRGEMMETFQRQIEDAKRTGCTWLFHNEGKQMFTFYKAWETATVAAGLPDLLFHDLRRTAVRNLVRSGMTRKLAMAITGHKTENVFERYNITDEKDLAVAADQMAAYMDRLNQQLPSLVLS